MPIRWKLSIATGLPLIVLLGVLLAIDYAGSRRAALASASSRFERIAALYAAEFDAELREVAQIARNAAALLEDRPGLPGGEVYALLRRNVEIHPLVYASAAAFEPTETGIKRCPYVYRGPGASTGLKQMDIADAYDYTGAEIEWYRAPVDGGAAHWSEPYFDEGAGDVEMVTFSVPFRREGAIAGVVTVDVQLSDVRERAITSDARGMEMLILSREGRFIVAPEGEWLIPATAQRPAALELARTAFSDAQLDAPETRLFEAMTDGESGTMRLSGLGAGHDTRGSAFFGPFGDRGWSIAGVAPDTLMFGPARWTLQLRLALGLAALAVVVAVTLAVSARVVQPVQDLAETARRIEAGDLEARSAIRSRDELGDLAGAFNAMVVGLRDRARLKGGLDDLRRAFAANSLKSPGRLDTASRTTMVDDGGDFLELFEHDDAAHPCLGALIGHVDGAGPPPVLIMSTVRAVIHGVLLAGGSLAEAVGAANRAVAIDMTPGRSMVLFCLAAERDGANARYVCAGLKSAFVLGQGGALRPAGDEGWPLGVDPGAAYVEHRLDDLEPGSVLIASTPGLFQFRDEAGRAFDVDQLERNVKDLAGFPAAQIAERLQARLDRFAAGGERVGEVSFIVARLPAARGAAD